jgi:hypothetical protein
MAIRNLFSIILKVLGIFMLKDLIISLGQVIPILVGNYFLVASYETLSGGYILVVLIHYLMFHFLVFKTDFVIDKLKLDKGITYQEFSFFKEKGITELDFKPIIALALMATAIYLLATEIPTLFSLLFGLYRENQVYDGNPGTQGGFVILSITKIIIAYILINACDTITDFIDRKRAKNSRKDQS